jgi:hypothetical protein
MIMHSKPQSINAYRERKYVRIYVICNFLAISIVRVVKSRRMRWAGHVARMGEGRGLHRVLVGKPEGKRPDPDVDGRIILRGIFRK